MQENDSLEYMLFLLRENNIPLYFTISAEEICQSIINADNETILFILNWGYNYYPEILPVIEFAIKYKYICKP